MPRTSLERAHTALKKSEKDIPMKYTPKLEKIVASFTSILMVF